MLGRFIYKTDYIDISENHVQSLMKDIEEIIKLNVLSIFR